MMFDVTAMGELLIDFACREVDAAGYPTMKANPGGAPGNLLAALNCYGCKTAFLGKVGDDAFGRMLVGTMKNAGIETRGILMDNTVFTTLAFVTFDETGNRSFSFARKPGADTQIRFEELDLSLIDDCRDFHFGTLSLTGEPARAATQQAVAYAKEKGKIISFDPNLRKPLWDDLEEAKKQILWGCGAEEGARILHEEYGVTLAFVTLGPKGCRYSNGKEWGEVETPKGLNVIDTTGAGDIFGGSVLSRILQSGKAIGEITGEELGKMTRFACCAASLSTQRSGGISSVVPMEDVLALAEA